jgi:cystathionine gamma-synthase
MSYDASHEKLSTRAITAGRPEGKAESGINQSISLNSTFTAGGPIGYGRSGNQTWSATESAISALEGGSTLIFSSGMAAITAALSTLEPGARVVASHQGYSGVMTLLKQHHTSGRLVVTFVDISQTDQVMSALKGADLLWLESPTNPCLDVAELPELISAAKSLNILVMVDNTFATALTQRPLAMGADIVMNSVTKFLSGHSDVLLGSLSTENPEIFQKLEDARQLLGAIAGPFEAWLALRGIRTFPLRFHKACENALELARRLSTHPKVARVRYPGLPTDSQHERAKKFMKTFGAVLSFEIVGSPADADRVCDSSSIILHATSLGGVESLWERRRRWPNESPSVPENLIRLSVGCEDVDDVWADIQRALSAI